MEHHPLVLRHRDPHPPGRGGDLFGQVRSRHLLVDRNSPMHRPQCRFERAHHVVRHKRYFYCHSFRNTLPPKRFTLSVIEHPCTETPPCRSWTTPRPEPCSPTPKSPPATCAVAATTSRV